MFTGIVEELGVVAAVEPRADAATLTIACDKVLDDLTHGASVAVNGVCLTVTSFSVPGQGQGQAAGRFSAAAPGEVPGEVAAATSGPTTKVGRVDEWPDLPSGCESSGRNRPDCVEGFAVGGGVVGAADLAEVRGRPTRRAGAEGRFTADVMKETLDRTSLGDLAVGDLVNLERPVRLMDRLGGHIVQGHVDGVGTLVERHHGPHWDTVRISLPPGLDRYLVEKGSVTVDGVSLTVVDVTSATAATASRGTAATHAAVPSGAVAATAVPPATAAGVAAGGTTLGAGVGASRATARATATATATAVVADTGGEPASFTVGLIPTTLAATTLGRRAVGDQVNIEVDVLSKYIEKLSRIETETLPHVEKLSAEASELNGSPR